jgi:carboxyl-terminal processing protease
VVKLKSENIQSLILDLRYNGGGSMNEAMQLAGIFIDEGVLAFAKYNAGKPMAIRDPNRGTIYDGPLVVMVNKGSASASEMVTSALQDYNRALIVGSPTYGKATMQVVFPMDTSVDLERYSESRFNSGSEFVKVTLGRFYRVTGSTHQLKGVQPDIYLPDLTEAAGYGEAFQRYPLAPDTVKRASYFKPLPPLPIAQLSDLSAARVKASEAFNMVGSYKDFVKKARRMAKESVPLQYEEYLDFSKKYRKEAVALEKQYEAVKKAGIFKTKNLEADADRIKLEHKVDDLKKTMENIDKDIYIQECFSIITDYLKTTKK